MEGTKHQDALRLGLKFSLDELTVLEEFIGSRVTKLVSKQLQEYSDLSESTDTNKLCAALSKAQGLFPRIEPNRSGHYLNSNYADLNTLVRAVQPALEANGLSVTHQIDSTKDGTMLTSKLRHESGQFVRSKIRILGAKSDLEFSESIKTMKRKSFESLLNITYANDIEDSDSEAETSRSEKEMVSGGFKAPKKRYETISKDLQNELEKELNFFPDLADALFTELKIRSLADISKEDFDEVITTVRKRKEARASGNYDNI